MPKRCQVTGKKAAKGRSITRRGIAKKKKGIGLNTTGITKRKFQPNLKTKRLWFAEENRFIKLRVAISTLRTIDKLGVAAIVRKLRKEGQKI